MVNGTTPLSDILRRITARLDSIDTILNAPSVLITPPSTDTPLPVVPGPAPISNGYHQNPSKQKPVKRRTRSRRPQTSILSETVVDPSPIPTVLPPSEPVAKDPARPFFDADSLSASFALSFGSFFSGSHPEIPTWGFLDQYADVRPVFDGETLLRYFAASSPLPFSNTYPEIPTWSFSQTNSPSSDVASLASPLTLDVVSGDTDIDSFEEVSPHSVIDSSVIATDEEAPLPSDTPKRVTRQPSRQKRTFALSYVARGRTRISNTEESDRSQLPLLYTDVHYRSGVRRAIDRIVEQSGRTLINHAPATIVVEQLADFPGFETSELRTAVNLPEKKAKKIIGMYADFVEQHLIIRRMNQARVLAPATKVEPDPASDVLDVDIENTDDESLPDSPLERTIKIPKTNTDFRAVGSLITQYRQRNSSHFLKFAVSPEVDYGDLKAFLAERGYALTEMEILEYVTNGPPQVPSVTYSSISEPSIERTFMLPEEFSGQILQQYGSDVYRLLETATGVSRGVWDNALAHTTGLTVDQISKLYAALPDVKMPERIRQLVQKNSVA